MASREMVQFQKLLFSLYMNLYTVRCVVCNVYREEGKEGEKKGGGGGVE